MKDFELEKELEKVEVIIDVEKLTKSNIKQIVLPIYRFIEWRCCDADKNFLRKTEMFTSCLSRKDAEKAKTLNRLYFSHIWNLLDEDIKKDMNFDDFVE